MSAGLICPPAVEWVQRPPNTSLRRHCLVGPAGPMRLEEAGGCVLGLGFDCTGLEPEADRDGWLPRLFGGRGPVPVFLQGTPFQMRVWQALAVLPCGQTTHYGALAAAIGQPAAARAVGQAVGANPVAWLVPCHRVVAA
ncbi:MAG: methylated-DNA--[protein]-cysteine S-methyltransferase, partial [Gammaproteobacteria bacterium]